MVSVNKAADNFNGWKLLPNEHITLFVQYVCALNLIEGHFWKAAFSTLTHTVGAE